MIGTIIYVGGENVTFRPISSQNRRFPFDSDPGKLTILRRLTLIVLGDETTLTEDTKRVSMSLGVGLLLDFSLVSSCSLFLSVLIGLFYCVGVCVGGGVATSSLFSSFFVKQLQVVLSNRTC